MTHPTKRLDDDVHQRVRLGILAFLSGVTRADFNQVKATLGTTDGNLGQHLRVLEYAGLIATTKTGAGQRARTWVRITGKGRTALDREIQALKEIVAIVEAPAGQPTPKKQRPGAHKRPDRAVGARVTV
jgi:DNA-binding MarR family transcriptional regulator